MLITHGHSDHTGDAVVDRAVERRAGRRAVRAVGVARSRRGSRTSPAMNPGGTLTMRGLSITMVPAVHSSSVEEDGSIVYLGSRDRLRRSRFEDGLTIYFAGDTVVFGDMRLIARDLRAVDRVPADRRPLHDGAGAGGARRASCSASSRSCRCTTARSRRSPARRSSCASSSTPKGVQVLELKPGETAADSQA